jgi:5-methylcytosine-specific restriction protein A
LVRNDRDYQRRRRQNSADARFLNSSDWRKIRATHLRKHPLCVHCKDEGKVVPADQVDHIQPPYGDTALMRDPSNLQSLCISHHARKTHAQRTGFFKDIDPLTGRYRDPRHPSNAREDGDRFGRGGPKR